MPLAVGKVAIAKTKAFRQNLEGKLINYCHFLKFENPRVPSSSLGSGILKPIYINLLTIS